MKRWSRMNFKMNENEKERGAEKNCILENSSFKVSELLFAIESLSKGRLRSDNEQKHVKEESDRQKLQLSNLEMSTTNENQLIKIAKLSEYSNIRPVSKIFSAYPQRSIFECNMDTKSLKWNIDTKLQVNQKGRLVCNWPQKPKFDNQFDRGISPPKKKTVQLFNRDFRRSSFVKPFPPEKRRQQRPPIEKTRQVRNPCPSIKSFLIRSRIQKSTLAGPICYEPFLGLKDLQWKLYKGAMRRKAPEVLMDKHKCIIQPILTSGLHKGSLCVPLICKGNKYIEAF
ncbi:iron-sulfur cluster assembly 1 homolog, mitochondrial isoform X1 [Chiloscyllium punctatum]|uniref:iron-sulfur cluster assembly 1 homolog, mitochondrial isoform X1 n=1 Tax=Chiloscyllium punctatum TaxID=137246 RepID=UPI003B63E092